MTLSEMGNVDHALGDYLSARSLLSESLLVFRQLGDKRGVAENLSRLPRVLLAQGHTRDAVILWGAAEALRESIGTPQPRHELEEHQRQAERARAVLGESAFADAWGEGRTLTWEQAAAYALEGQSLREASGGDRPSSENGLRMAS